MKTLFLSLALVFAWGAAGCTSRTYEKTVRTQTVISEEPVLGQPAHAAPSP